MKKCPFDGKVCRGTLGCDMGICAKKVDCQIDDWSEKYGWEKVDE